MKSDFLKEICGKCLFFKEYRLREETYDEETNTTTIKTTNAICRFCPPMTNPEIQINYKRPACYHFVSKDKKFVSSKERSQP